jgi:hypothetical protein
MSLNHVHWKAPFGLFLLLLVLPSVQGAAAASVPQIDKSKNGIYESGPWRYEFSVSSPGSKSEGYHGKLLYNGAVLPEPASVYDYYQTPWGPMYWVGDSVVLWGTHGWIPLSKSPESAGRALPVPTIAGELIVYAEVLAPEELGTPDRLEKRAWVLADLKGFGAKAGHVQQDWFHLGKESVTIHDTKRWGTAQIRLTPTASDKLLAVEIIGRGTLLTAPPKQDVAPTDSATPGIAPKATQTVELPRQAGATRLVKYTLEGLPFDERLELYLAFRVESLGRTLVLGPEANGKSVAVKDIDTVIIRLPVDDPNHAAWTVSSVSGKAVEALGSMEFEEDTSNPFKIALGGTFKALFRVQQKGRATVKLECRPWEQKGQTKSQSFQVRLNVQSVAAQPADKQTVKPGLDSQKSQR